MGKSKKLVNRIVEFGACFNESTVEEYIGFLEGEIQELKQALIQSDRTEIKRELGDVILNIQLIYSKLNQQYQITPFEVYRSQLYKHKSRAPHIFEGEYLGKEEEMKRWKLNKLSSSH